MNGPKQIDITEGFRESSSGLYLPTDFKARPIALDLFSGCGGMSLGFLKAGYEVLAGVESDCAAAATYLYNLGTWPMNITWITPQDKDRMERFLQGEYKRAEKAAKGGIVTYMTTGGNPGMHGQYPPVRNFFFGDIRQLSGEQICEILDIEVGELDCIAGGPPCQGFSTSGKRNVMDPRSSLVFEMTRLIRELRPKTMVLENVPGIVGMVTPEGIGVIDAIAMDLEGGGWGDYDAIRKSMLSREGARAAIRAPKKRPSKAVKVVGTPSLKPEAQPNLFL